MIHSYCYYHYRYHHHNHTYNKILEPDFLDSTDLILNLTTGNANCPIWPVRLPAAYNQIGQLCSQWKLRRKPHKPMKFNYLIQSNQWKSRKNLGLHGLPWLGEENKMADIIDPVTFIQTCFPYNLTICSKHWPRKPANNKFNSEVWFSWAISTIK